MTLPTRALGRSGLEITVQCRAVFALLELPAMMKSNGRTSFLIAPTVLDVSFMRFLGLSAQAIVLLRLRRLGKRAPTHYGMSERIGAWIRTVWAGFP
jgi:hypothetical protein